jgi:hypothetical protein
VPYARAPAAPSRIAAPTARAAREGLKKIAAN